LEHLQFTCNAKPHTPEAAAALEAYEKEQQQLDGGASPSTTSAAAGAAAAAAGSSSPEGPRLCTLLTALVDLPCAGRRLVAQSIIPGILSGDQVSGRKKKRKKETGSTFCVNIYLVVGVPFGPCAVFHNTPANLNLSLPHDSLAIPNPISIL